MRANREQIVLPARRADEPGSAVFVFRDEPAVFAELDVAADFVAAVVARGTIGIEADEAGKPAGAAVHLVHDLFVVDAFQQLPGEAHAGGLAASPELVEKAVGDE